MLETLLIETDYESIDRAWRETLMLARTHRLTVYDACYLELAVRRGLPLATLDKELAAAGRKLGVEGVGVGYERYDQKLCQKMVTSK